MLLSKPHDHFTHRRTVRLTVEDDLGEIDAFKIAKSLPDYKDLIKGIVPVHRGTFFDITLPDHESAAKLANEAMDYEQLLIPLCLHPRVYLCVGRISRRRPTNSPKYLRRTEIPSCTPPSLLRRGISTHQKQHMRC